MTCMYVIGVYPTPPKCFLTACSNGLRGGVLCTHNLCSICVSGGGVRTNPTMSSYHPPPHPRSQQLNSSHMHFCPLFQARIKFPVDYPYSPPAFRFLTKMWHPNIYEVEHTHTVLHCVNTPERDGLPVKNLSCPPQNGDVCISILHPPVDDPQSGELPSERWNPTQNVRYSSSLHSFKRCEKVRTLINKLPSRPNPPQEFSNYSIWSRH